MKRIFTLLSLITLIFNAASAQQWTTITAVPFGTVDLRSVDFAGDNAIVAVGLQGACIRSTDKGDSWETVNLGTGEYLQSVQFISETTGFLVGTSGLLMKTTDSGASWSTVSIPTNVDLFDVYFFNEDRGFVVGGSDMTSPTYTNIIASTTDGGATWQVGSVLTGIMLDIHFVNDQLGFIVGGDVGTGVVWKTTNGGSNWTQDYLSNGIVLWEVDFIDENNGFIAGIATNDNHMLKTTDGGDNWTGVNALSNNYTTNSVTVVDPNNIYVGGYDGDGAAINFSENNGLDWTVDYTQSGFLFEMKDIAFRNEDLGIAVGGFDTQGLVAKYMGNPSGVFNIRPTLDFQVSPNPATANSAINLVFSEEGEYSIEFADLAGRISQTEQGFYLKKAKIELKLPAGIYSVKISGERGFGSSFIVVR